MIIHGERPFRQRTKQGLTIAPMKSGRFMLRVKSSLSAKRVKQDPAFIPLMEDAGRMKIASPLAARVYRDFEIKDVRIYRKMVGRAKGLLKKGLSVPDIEIILRKEYGPVEMIVISTGQIYPVREVPVVMLYHAAAVYISSA